MHSALNFIVKLYNAVCSYEQNKKNLETNSSGRKADVYNIKKVILESAGLSHENVEAIINDLKSLSTTNQVIESKIPAGYFIDYVRLRSDVLIACDKLQTGLLGRSQLRSYLYQVFAEPAHSKENLLKDMITDRDEAIARLKMEADFLRNQSYFVKPNPEERLPASSSSNQAVLNPVPPSSFFSAASEVIEPNQFNPDVSPEGIGKIDKLTP